MLSVWSEWRDLNSRPYGPEPYALPNCATPRYNIYIAFASSVACLGARRACPLGLAFFTADLKLFVSFGDFACFVYALIANQTALHPDNIYSQSIFDCFCNIHQFRYFCNKNKSIISKNIICAVIFLLRHKKSIAKQSFVIYNNSRDGAWCSGSTWASDSHCVGSIPIAPANANTLTCEGVSFIFGALDACILCAPNIKEHTRSVFALSTIGEERKHAFACITQLICIFISNLYLQIL